MRILVFFGASLLEPRGTPSRARNLTLALTAAGCSVATVSGDPPAAVSRELGAAGVKTFQAAPSNRRGPADRGLGAAARAFAPDLVFGHTHKALAPLAALRPPGAPAGRPLLVADLHGDLAAERWQRPGRSGPRRLLSALRVAAGEAFRMPRMDAVTVVSSALAERVRPYGVPVKVLWGGVDPSHFRPSTAGGHDGDALRIAYAGNFLPYQGVGTLLDAAELLLRRHRRLELLLVGDLDTAPQVRRRARELFGPRLTAPGLVPYQRVPELLAGADVLVVPRPDHRTARFGFPSKLPEYLAVGRPVVATDVGEQGRLIRDGETGLLVPPGDAAALAAALDRLRDPLLRRRLGTAGREFAAARLTWTAIAGELLAFVRPRLRRAA